MATELQNNQPNNQQNTQIDPSQNQQTGGGEASSTGGGGGTVPNAPAANGTPQRQGSGRYTNLQKYITANQGAGNRLYQGIGSQLNRETSGTEKQASTQASQIAQNVQNSRETLNRGQGYQNQMQAQDFNAENFANNQDQLNDFSKFKAGQNVDEAGLQNQQQQYSDLVNSGQNLVNQRGQQVQSEEGRFGLLQNTFGGRGATSPQYSQGQQRLDQLFLQSGQGNNVKQLQDIVNQKAQQFQGLQNQGNQYATDINDVASQEKLLGTGLQTAADTNEQRMMDALTAKVGTTNTEREAERIRAKQYYDTLQGKAPAGGNLFGSNNDLSQMLGLQQNQQTWNVIPQLSGISDVFNVSQRNANNAQDVATAQDVSKYDALARLKYGNVNDTGQFQFDPTQKKISEVGNLDPVVAARNDEMALNKRIENAKNDFMTRAGNESIHGYGKGQGGDVTALYGSVKDALDRNQDINNFGTQYYNPWESAYATQGVATEKNPYEGWAERPDLQAGQDQQAQAWRDQSQQQSQQRAYEDYYKSLNDSFLTRNGFYNYLSDNGVKGSEQQMANMGYGKGAAGTQGFYTAPGQVNLDDIMGGADLTLSPEERMAQGNG